MISGRLIDALTAAVAAVLVCSTAGPLAGQQADNAELRPLYPSPNAPPWFVNLDSKAATTPAKVFVAESVRVAGMLEADMRRRVRDGNPVLGAALGGALGLGIGLLGYAAASSTGFTSDVEAWPIAAYAAGGAVAGAVVFWTLDIG